MGLNYPIVSTVSTGLFYIGSIMDILKIDLNLWLSSSLFNTKQWVFSERQNRIFRCIFPSTNRDLLLINKDLKRAFRVISLMFSRNEQTLDISSVMFLSYAQVNGGSIWTDLGSVGSVDA